MQKIIGFHNKNENIDIMQRNVCTGQAADLKCSGTFQLHVQTEWSKVHRSSSTGPIQGDGCLAVCGTTVMQHLKQTDIFIFSYRLCVYDVWCVVFVLVLFLTDFWIIELFLFPFSFNVFTLFCLLVVRSVVCGEHGWRRLVWELGEQQWERRLYITSSNHRRPRGRGVCSVTFDLSNVWGFCRFNGSKLTWAQSRGSRFTYTRVQLQRFSPSCQWQEEKFCFHFDLFARCSETVMAFPLWPRFVFSSCCHTSSKEITPVHPPLELLMF